MSKVKLLSDVSGQGELLKEGSVVDLDDALAAHFVSIGVAEATDAKATAVVTETPKAEGVETAADPLVNTQAAGEQTPSAAAPASSPTQSPEAQPSSSTNLHLG